MHLNHIHSLRGIAILFVVFGHALWFQFNWSNNQPTITFLIELLSNGTILFVFVAGYLFQYLLPKYHYPKYLKAKLKNVIAPYLLISIPAIAYEIFIGSPSDKFTQLEDASTPLQVLWFYAVGGGHINYALWFIPMITLFFIGAPLFALFNKYPKAYWLLIPLYVLALAVHREPFPIISPLRAFLYFLPIYITGMFAAQFREKLDPVLTKHAPAIGLLLAVIFLCQLFINEHHGIYKTEHMFDMSKGYIDWLLLQKTLLCFFLIGIYLRYPKLATKPINYLADISFTVFFIHVYFFAAVYIILGHQRFEGSLGLWFVRGCACILFCVVATWLAKKVLGKYSRPLIGS